MTVVLVVPQLTPVYGMERATLSLLEHLDLPAVHVIALSGDLPEAAPSGVTWESLRLPAGMRRVAAALRPLRARLCELQPTTVVSSGLWASVPALLVAPDPASVVVWEHSLMPHRIAEEPAVRAYASAARALYRRARSVVAVSDVVAETVRHLTRGAVPVEVIPNVVQMPGRPLPPTPPRRDGLRLLSVGSLCVRKNHLLAVRALEHLPAGTTLTILGGGPEREALEAAVGATAYADRVVLAGYAADPAPEFAACDVVVHPSLAETFGLAAVEASWYGKPVAVLDRAPLNGFVPALCPGAVAAEPTPEAFAAAVLDAAAAAGDGPDFARARDRQERALAPDRIARAWRAQLGAADELSPIENGRC